MVPKVLVISGYGINSEEETKYAFEWAGGKADIVHINDLIGGLYKLTDYQIIAFPGGFAFGDDTGSGNAFANKIKSNLGDEFEKYIKGDHLIIGICNGFQMMVNLGLLPALGKFGEREVALVHNDSAKFINRWTDVAVKNNSPWLKDLKQFSMVMAHGEGKLVMDKKVLNEMKKKNCIALTYSEGEIFDYQNLTENPTGTTENIAGITDESGKLFGLMPHPERSMFFTQRPDWPLLKDKFKREGREIPTEGPGLQIFKNAIDYFHNE